MTDDFYPNNITPSSNPTSSDDDEDCEVDGEEHNNTPSPQGSPVKAKEGGNEKCFSRNEKAGNVNKNVAVQQ